MYGCLQNATFKLLTQTYADEKTLQKLYVLEAAVRWLRKHQQALWTHSRLSCAANYHSVCVTPIVLNSSKS